MTPHLHIHVDLDNLWALGECYGVSIPPQQRHALLHQAIPILLQLFADQKISATFFVVGNDLLDPKTRQLLQTAISKNHTLANHSTTHPLNFRALPLAAAQSEITQCHNLILETTGVAPIGFRAPGYGFRTDILKWLPTLGYRYDSSLMPSWSGPILRFLDKRIQAQNVLPPKTQFPLLRDWFRPNYPFPISDEIAEYPVAASPWLRMPFQAGVCLKVGPTYFKLHHQLAKNHPMIFLIHAADIADFTQFDIPMFNQSKAFNSPVEPRRQLLKNFLITLQTTHQTLNLEHQFTPSPPTQSPHS